LAPSKATAGSKYPVQARGEIVAHRASEEVTGANEAHTDPGVGEPGSQGVLVEVIFFGENPCSDPNAIVEKEGALPAGAERLYPQAVIV